MTYSIDATGIKLGDDHILLPVNSFQLYRGISTDVCSYEEADGLVKVQVRWTTPLAPRVVKWDEGKPVQTEWTDLLVRGWLRRMKPEREPDGFLVAGYVTYTMRREGENMSTDCAVTYSATKHGRPLVPNFARTGSYYNRYRGQVHPGWANDVLRALMDESNKYYTEQDDLESLCEKITLRLVSDPPAWLFKSKVKVPDWLAQEVDGYSESAGYSFDPTDGDAFAFGRNMLHALNIEPSSGYGRSVRENWSVYPTHYSCEFEDTLWSVLRRDGADELQAWTEKEKELRARYESLMVGLPLFRMLYGAEEVARNMTLKCKRSGHRDEPRPCVEEEYELEHVARDVYDVDGDDADICFNKLIVTQSTLMGIAEEVVDLIDDSFRLIANQIEDDYDYQTSTEGILEAYNDSIFEVATIVQSIIRELT